MERPEKLPEFLAPTPAEWAEIINFTKGASTTADAMQAAMMAWNLCVEKHFAWCKEEEKQRAALQSNEAKSQELPRKYNDTYNLTAILNITRYSMTTLANELDVGHSTIYSWKESNRIPSKYNENVERVLANIKPNLQINRAR